MLIKTIKLLSLTSMLFFTMAFAQTPLQTLEALDINPNLTIIENGVEKEINIITEIEKELIILSQQPKYVKSDLFKRFEKMNTLLSHALISQGTNIDLCSEDGLREKILATGDAIRFDKNLASFKGKLSKFGTNARHVIDPYINYAIYLGLIGKYFKAYVGKLGYNLSNKLRIPKFTVDLKNPIVSPSENLAFVEPYYDNLYYLLDTVFEVDPFFIPDLVAQI
ncbi:MAG TPA: hypothetical protein PKC21_01755 [Oligoflexia bacterium]|nr:hypothetical protein [Oligoflexia bacterium]